MKQIIKGFLLIGVLAAIMMIETHAKSNHKKSRFLPNSFEASFTQEYISSLKGKKKSSKGEINYLYPGKILLKTKKPQEMTYVSNNIKSWLYRPALIPGEPGELTVNSNGSKNQYTRFFDILRNGMRNNQFYKVNKDKKGVIKLLFSSIGQKELKITSADIAFKNTREKFISIKKIDITFTDKKTFTLIFNKVKTNIKYAKNHFNFVAPKHTRIQ